MDASKVNSLDIPERDIISVPKELFHNFFVTVLLETQDIIHVPVFDTNI